MAALALALAAAGCGPLGGIGGGERATSKRCSNDALGYSLAYPAEWHHVDCVFFDPQPLQIPQNSDFYGAALEVQVAQDSFENIVRGLTDRRFARVRSREQRTAAGFPAVRIESVATGAGLYERGFQVYASVLDRGDKQPPVIVQATAAGGEPWGERRRVADVAVESLRFTG